MYKIYLAWSLLGGTINLALRLFSYSTSWIYLHRYTLQIFPFLNSEVPGTHWFVFFLLDRVCISLIHLCIILLFQTLDRMVCSSVAPTCIFSHAFFSFSNLLIAFLCLSQHQQKPSFYNFICSSPQQCFDCSFTSSFVIQKALHLWSPYQRTLANNLLLVSSHLSISYI